MGGAERTKVVLFLHVGSLFQWVEVVSHNELLKTVSG